MVGQISEDARGCRESAKESFKVIRQKGERNGRVYL